MQRGRKGEQLYSRRTIVIAEGGGVGVAHAQPVSPAGTRTVLVIQWYPMNIQAPEYI